MRYSKNIGNIDNYFYRTFCFNRWTLPKECDGCGFVIPAASIDETMADDEELKHVACPTCHYTNRFQPVQASGDPIYIALLGHWDGWQPFSSSGKHSCGMSKSACPVMKKANAVSSRYFVGFHEHQLYISGAIEVTIATLCAVLQPTFMLLDLCHATFYQKKPPSALDPFLDPLLSDVQNLSSVVKAHDTDSMALVLLLHILIQVASLASATPSVAYARFARSLTWA